MITIIISVALFKLQIQFCPITMTFYTIILYCSYYCCSYYTGGGVTAQLSLAQINTLLHVTKPNQYFTPLYYYPQSILHVTTTTTGGGRKVKDARTAAAQFLIAKLESCREDIRRFLIPPAPDLKDVQGYVGEHSKGKNYWSLIG